MSRGLNKVMIIGHLGREPEMRYTPSGRPVTSFSVATTRSWNSPDGERPSRSGGESAGPANEPPVEEDEFPF